MLSSGSVLGITIQSWLPFMAAVLYLGSYLGLSNKTGLTCARVKYIGNDDVYIFL